MKLTHTGNLDGADFRAYAQSFLCAAIELGQTGETLCVIGDDEQHLTVFRLNEDSPGRILRLLTGDLPRKARKLKKVKARL